MKVLMMCHLYPPQHNAGAEWMSHTLLRALVEAGHECDVLLSREVPGLQEYELDGVTVHPFFDKDQAPNMVESSDFVLSYLENMPRAVIVSRMMHKKFGVIMHNEHLGSTVWAVEDASLIVFNAEWVKANVEAEWGPRPNGMVITPPVLAADYKTRRGDAVTLVNLSADKGGGLFWALAAAMPDVPFIGVKGAYGPQLLGDMPNVQVLEHVPGHEMRDRVYGKTKILLAPSRYEAWGRVAVEAMVSGIPVIAHPTPGLSEALGNAGMLIDRDDLPAWKQGIEYLLESGPYMLATRAAFKRAKELDPAEDLQRFVAAVEATQ